MKAMEKRFEYKNFEKQIDNAIEIQNERCFEYFIKESYNVIFQNVIDKETPMEDFVESERKICEFFQALCDSRNVVGEALLIEKSIKKNCSARRSRDYYKKFKKFEKAKMMNKKIRILPDNLEIVSVLATREIAKTYYFIEDLDLIVIAQGLYGTLFFTSDKYKKQVFEIAKKQGISIRVIPPLPPPNAILYEKNIPFNGSICQTQFEEKIVILPDECKKIKRKQFIDTFVDKDSKYYQRNVARLYDDLEGKYYLGFMWECLKDKTTVAEEDIDNEIKYKQKIYVMWDINSSWSVLIDDYWKFGKDNILQMDFHSLMEGEGFLPEDIYIFDDSMTWCVAKTHDYINGKRYCVKCGENIKGFI